MLIIIASILLTVIKAKGFSMSIISDNYIKVWGIYCQQGLPGNVLSILKQNNKSSWYQNDVKMILKWSLKAIFQSITIN